MVTASESHLVRDVFVPGGLPTITYNSRDGLRLEDQVYDHLDSPYSILSVSGPTKTGKTVLIRHTTTSSIWLSGGALDSLSTFFEMILDEYRVPSSYDITISDESGSTYGRSGTGRIPAVADASLKSEKSKKSSSSVRQTEARSPRVAAREALLSGGRPLVIDDFHYIDQEVQLGIVRYLKDLIFEGLPVILIAVPHRAYDAVRVEKEMTGRVRVLEVGFWTDDELHQIASSGFSALNVNFPRNEFSNRFIEESFRSPHLMQEFCRGLCREMGINETLRASRTLTPPNEGWEAFFRRRASTASKTAFDRLARGPRQRSDRILRTLKDSRKVDIYGATLAAIAHTGPLTSITYEQLRAAFREVLESELPQRHEITRILDEMAKIARDQIEGEPVVDYDEKLSTLFISDPFFAYYLRWESQEISVVR